MKNDTDDLISDELGKIQPKTIERCIEWRDSANTYRVCILILFTRPDVDNFIISLFRAYTLRMGTCRPGTEAPRLIRHYHCASAAHFCGAL